jgi:cytochrome P450
MEARDEEGQPMTDVQFSPYEYLPFGGGARRCIGLAFAQWEMKLAIAKILTNGRIKLS